MRENEAAGAMVFLLGRYKIRETLDDFLALVQLRAAQ